MQQQLLLFSVELLLRKESPKTSSRKAKMAKEKSIEQKNQTKDKAEKEVQKARTT